ncbi:MAG: Fe-S-containing hydro-lyase [Planctomycetota bacterium]|jgi:fumarate hydratase subunit beta
MSVLNIQTPLTDDVIKKMKSGDRVLLSGTIFTARDAAHKKLADLISNSQPLPFDLSGSVIYYVGPSPAKPGAVIGSAGPTTSYRMDPYTPLLLANGLKAVIGKGQRSEQVVRACKEHTAVYFGATGGAAALLSKSIVQSEVIAFHQLGPEAIRKLTVKEMPLIVINDSFGHDLYADSRKKWAAN